MFARFSVCFGLAVVVALIAESAIFGSDLYWRYAEPDSTVGSVRTTVRLVDYTERRAETKPVLVIGDSREREGFSHLVADEEARYVHSPLRFASGGFPGASLKMLHYFTRHIDPTATRFAALVIMLPSYADDDPGPPPCAYELGFIHPLVGFADLPALMEGCPEPGSLGRTIEVLALRAGNYRRDLLAFLADIPGRIAAARGWNDDAVRWVAEYKGRPESLAGLSIEPGSGALQLPPGLPAVAAARLEAYAKRLPTASESLSVSIAYRQRWLGRILGRYGRAGTPVILMRLPRGPLHFVRHGEEPEVAAGLRELAGTPGLHLAPPQILRELERPQFFFDELHLNSAGRKAMSRLVARSAIMLLAPAAPP
jgi:hypothetical protein